MSTVRAALKELPRVDPQLGIVRFRVIVTDAAGDEQELYLSRPGTRLALEAGGETLHGVLMDAVRLAAEGVAPKPKALEAYEGCETEHPASLSVAVELDLQELKEILESDGGPKGGNR